MSNTNRPTVTSAMTSTIETTTYRPTGNPVSSQEDSTTAVQTSTRRLTTKFDNDVGATDRQDTPWTMSITDTHLEVPVAHQNNRKAMPGETTTKPGGLLGLQFTIPVSNYRETIKKVVITSNQILEVTSSQFDEGKTLAERTPKPVQGLEAVVPELRNSIETAEKVVPISNLTHVLETTTTQLDGRTTMAGSTSKPVQGIEITVPEPDSRETTETKSATQLDDINTMAGTTSTSKPVQVLDLGSNNKETTGTFKPIHGLGSSVPEVINDKQIMQSTDLTVKPAQDLALATTALYEKKFESGVGEDDLFRPIIRKLYGSKHGRLPDCRNRPKCNKRVCYCLKRNKSSSINLNYNYMYLLYMLRILHYRLLKYAQER